jgi:hypothetical protein
MVGGGLTAISCPATSASNRILSKPNTNELTVARPKTTQSNDFRDSDTKSGPAKRKTENPIKHRYDPANSIKDA